MPVLSNIYFEAQMRLSFILHIEDCLWRCNLVSFDIIYTTIGIHPHKIRVKICRVRFKLLNLGYTLSQPYHVHLTLYAVTSASRPITVIVLNNCMHYSKALGFIKVKLLKYVLKVYDPITFGFIH